MVNRNTSVPLIPFLALILGGICIGFSPIFVRLVDLGPIALGFYRMVLCLPILLVIHFAAARPAAASKLLSRRQVYCGCLLVIVFFTGDLVFWHASIQHTSVANSTLLANTAVLFVPIAAWLLFKQPINRLFVVGMCCAFAGVAMLGANSLQLGWRNIYGDLFGLITGLCYSGYLLSMNWVRSTLPARQLMVLSNIGCSVCLLVLMLIFENQWLPYSLYALMILFALAWISQLAGQGLIIYGIGLVPAALAAVTLLVQPLVAAGVAWVAFDEALDRLQILGALAVLAGLVICRQSSSGRTVVSGD